MEKFTAQSHFVEEDSQYTKELRRLDTSFINSVLSYAIYTKNASWFENWAQLKAMNPTSTQAPQDIIAQEGIFQKESRAHDRVFAALVAQTFTPAELNLKSSDNHTSKDYIYAFDSQYKNGIYKAQDNLAGACAMKTRNPDGSQTLHISFRGTDNQAQPFSKFLAKAYPDMAAYYESFKPFEKACLEYAKNKDNRITKIEVSGHSLGGAMVQHFFRSQEVKDIGIPMEGITFGSPHALSNTLYSILPAARHMLVHGNFKLMAVTLYDTLTFKNLRDRIFHREERITQYQHSGDLIPKVAALAMSKTGKNIVTLKDAVSDTPNLDHLLTNADKSYYGNMYKKLSKTPSAYDNFKNMAASTCETYFNKPIKKALRVLNVTYHDMARYSLNLENEIALVRDKEHKSRKTRAVYFSAQELHVPTRHVDKYNGICRGMGIHNKGTEQLEGRKVTFNEYLNPDEMSLKLNSEMTDIIRANIKNIMKNNTASYHHNSSPYRFKN